MVVLTYNPSTGEAAADGATGDPVSRTKSESSQLGTQKKSSQKVKTPAKASVQQPAPEGCPVRKLNTPQVSVTHRKIKH